MPKVLVIEDEFDVAQSIKSVLEEENFEVLIGIGGHDALEKLETYKPDVILLDIIMPIMDGTEVLKKLRENKATKNIPVVAVTAISASAGIKNELLGIDPKIGFIEKPYHIDDLLKEIKSTIKKA